MVELASADQAVGGAAPAANFLARVNALIDWTALDPAAGAPVFAVKIALLKEWYGLSDSEAHGQVLDRLSFRAFLGFAGDGNPDDAGILNELNYGSFARGPAMAGILIDVEQQLRRHGYAVRAGELREPSLIPCTENGNDVPHTGATSLFDPGELGRMLEAVTAKAHAQGIDPVASPAELQPAAEAAMRPAPADAVTELRPGIRAILEWPWGKRTELTEHLNIGRDFAFSPLAKELTPYTHVSRKHAEMMIYGEGVWVRDLGSRNGTFVNDEEVPKGQAVLIDGDATLRFGPALAVSLKIYG